MEFILGDLCLCGTHLERFGAACTDAAVNRNQPRLRGQWGSGAGLGSLHQAGVRVDIWKDCLLSSPLGRSRGGNLEQSTHSESLNSVLFSCFMQLIELGRCCLLETGLLSMNH